MIIPILLLFLMVVAQPAWATTYFVKKTGNDSTGDGSNGAPWLTVTKGLGELAAGDTLNICVGTYTETITEAKFGATGTSGARITVQACTGDTVTIRPSGAGFAVRFDDTSASYVTLTGLIFDLQDDAMGDGSVIIYIGDTGGGPTAIHILDSELVNGNDNCVLAQAGTGHRFANLEIHNCGLVANDSNGMYLAGIQSSTIEDIHVYDCACYGIRVWNSGASPKADDNIIRRIRTHANGDGHAFGGQAETCSSGGGGFSLGDSDNLLSNSLTYDNLRGIEVQGVGTRTLLYNNSVYDNDLGVQILTGADDTELKNTIMFGNTTALQDLGTNTVQTTNLTTDPSFTNAASGDFTLQAGSDAIDAGTTLAAVTSDFIGTSRPQGPAHDIGAFEFESDDGDPHVVTHDATSTDNDNNNAQNPTASHTRGAVCPNPVALVSVAWQDSATAAVLSSVTYDGNAMTSLCHAGAGCSGTRLAASANDFISLFLYKNPAAGPITVQANFDSAANDSTIRTSTYCNVDQTTSTGTVAGATGNGTAVAVNVSSATGELVIDAVEVASSGGVNATTTVGASQTLRASFTVAGNHRHDASEEPGAATTAMTWTLSASRAWASLGVALKPSSEEPLVLFLRRRSGQ